MSQLAVDQDVDVPTSPPERIAVKAVVHKEKLSTKARNDREWDIYKDEIERIYVCQGKTLPQTMREIGKKAGFKKSLRSWKSKMKDWGFDKNMTSDIQFMVAKAAKRQREEGKDTEFSRDGLQVPQETLEKFKRKKVGSATEAVSPVVATPPDISYATPRAISEPKDGPSAPKSPLPSRPDIENVLDVDKEAENQDDIVDISISTDIEPNLDAGLNSHLKPDQPLLGVTSKPLHLSIWGIPAALSMEALFKSFHKSNTPLNNEAFNRHMANVSLFISSETRDEENITALFQERFQSFVLADESKTLDKGPLRSAMIEEKLEIALKGFIRGNPHLNSEHCETVCKRFVKSFKGSSQGVKYWKARFIFAKILFEVMHQREAIDEFMESIYELLMLRKPDPAAELMEILHELKGSNFLTIDILPELNQRVLLETIQRETTRRVEANTNLLYLASALACRHLYTHSRATTEKLIRFIRPHLEALRFERWQTDWAVILLQLFKFYHQNDGLSQAVSLASKAYVTTKSLLLPYKRDEMEIWSYLYPWEYASFYSLKLAWMAVTITPDLKQEFPETVAQIEEMHRLFRPNDQEDETIMPEIPEAETIIEHSENTMLCNEADNISESDLQDQRRTGNGMTYPESMISGRTGMTGLTGLSWDLTGLFPSSAR